MLTKFLRAVTGPLLACLALLAAAPAQATYVVGSWDPPYGLPFTNLGWRGTTTLLVPNSCLTAPGIVVNNGLSCPLMTVISATVEFYDITDINLTTVETLNFTSQVGVGLVDVGPVGVVNAFSLFPTGSVLSTHALAITGFQQASFALEIEYTAGVSTATLHWTVPDESVGGRNSFSPIVRVTNEPEPLPEPATLALTAIALAGLGLARRRQA